MAPNYQCSGVHRVSSIGAVCWVAIDRSSLVNRKTFSATEGLVRGEQNALEYPCVRWNAIAFIQTDDVARNDIASGNPASTFRPDHKSPWTGEITQRVKGALRPLFLN